MCDPACGWFMKHPWIAPLTRIRPRRPNRARCRRCTSGIAIHFPAPLFFFRSFLILAQMASSFFSGGHYTMFTAIVKCYQILCLAFRTVKLFLAGQRVTCRDNCLRLLRAVFALASASRNSFQCKHSPWKTASAPGFAATCRRISAGGPLPGEARAYRPRVADAGKSGATGRGATNQATNYTNYDAGIRVIRLIRWFSASLAPNMETWYQNSNQLGWIGLQPNSEIPQERRPARPPRCGTHRSRCRSTVQIPALERPAQIHAADMSGSTVLITHRSICWLRASRMALTFACGEVPVYAATVHDLGQRGIVGQWRNRQCRPPCGRLPDS